jgi:hypothetical protein
MLCVISVSFTALADLRIIYHQHLCRWLHSRGIVQWPLSRQSSNMEWISKWVSECRIEEDLAGSADSPTSPSPITGQKRRLGNTPNERPLKVPRAATAAPLGSEAFKFENVDTGVIEGTGENGEKDQDCAQLQDCMCCSQSLHYSY